MALLDKYDTWRLARLCLAELAGAAALGGDADGASAWLRRADRHRRQPGRLMEPWVELNRAWTVAASGDTSTAAAHARRAADLARATGQPTHEATSLYTAARLGDAHAVRGRLAGLAERLTAPFITNMAQATAALADCQAAPLERTAAAFRELGLYLYAAEAVTAAAEMHWRAGRHTRANRCLEQAAMLRSECDQARTPLLESTNQTAALTRREREVALLAAANRSSREIADRLSLSVRTVDNYLSRAYAKLGVSGRTELARHLGPRDLGAGR